MQGWYEHRLSFLHCCIYTCLSGWFGCSISVSCNVLCLVKLSSVNKEILRVFSYCGGSYSFKPSYISELCLILHNHLSIIGFKMYQWYRVNKITNNFAHSYCLLRIITYYSFNRCMEIIRIGLFRTAPWYHWCVVNERTPNIAILFRFLYLLIDKSLSNKALL